MLEHTAQDYRIMRHMFEISHFRFTRFFLRYLEGVKFIKGRHHKILADTINKIFTGDIKRLLITIPPGMTKTVMAVISVVTRGLALNPRARFIHVSSGEELVNENSDFCKEIIESEHYQAMWPTEIRSDKDSKRLWRTNRGGGLLAVPAGGNMMGFRAGRMNKDEWEFNGALIYDDPTKADDAESKVKLQKGNKRFTAVVRTRIADKNVPIIVIMQRIAENDLAGFLLKGGSGDVWDHLDLPVEILEDAEPYPSEYTHGRPVEYDLPIGPLWDYKYDADEIKKLKVDESTFWAQFMQRPQKYSGGVFHDEHWKYYERYDARLNRLYYRDGSYESLSCKRIYSDTAMKKEETHDFSVIQLWGVGDVTGNLFLLDQVRGKWEAFRLKGIFKAFSARHDYKPGKNMLGIRDRKVEDKASGTGLIQDLQNELGSTWIEGIPRDKDKVSRARSVLTAIAEGKVFLPYNAYWLDEYRDEFKEFNAFLTHKHDDQIDPTVDAIEDNITIAPQIDQTYEAMLDGLDDENEDEEYEDFFDELEEDWGVAA